MINKEMQSLDINNKKQLKGKAFPLVRIKKIMKEQTSARYVSYETPFLISKACELLIIDLGHMCWINTILENRKTVQRTDLCKALAFHQRFDFCVDVIPEFAFERNKLISTTFPFVQYPFYYNSSTFDGNCSLYKDKKGNNDSFAYLNSGNNRSRVIYPNSNINISSNNISFSNSNREKIIKKNVNMNRKRKSKTKIIKK